MKKWDTLLFSSVALLILLGLGGWFLTHYLDPVNREMRRLQGEWELVRVDQYGEEENAAFFKKIYLVRGDRVTIFDSSNEKKEYCRIELNPRVRPKAIDLVSRTRTKSWKKVCLGFTN